MVGLCKTKDVKDCTNECTPCQNTCYYNMELHRSGSPCNDQSKYWCIRLFCFISFNFVIINETNIELVITLFFLKQFSTWQRMINHSIARTIQHAFQICWTRPKIRTALNIWSTRSNREKRTYHQLKPKWKAQVCLLWKLKAPTDLLKRLILIEIQ